MITAKLTKDYAGAIAGTKVVLVKEVLYLGFERRFEVERMDGKLFRSSDTGKMKDRISILQQYLTLA